MFDRRVRLALLASAVAVGGCRCDDPVQEIKCDFVVEPSGDDQAIEFPATEVDDEKVRSFKITNTGNTNLEVFEIAFDERNAQHYRVDVPDGFEVNPGADETLQVFFRPVAEAAELNASFAVKHAPIGAVQCPVARVFLRGSSFERTEIEDAGLPDGGVGDGGPVFDDAGFSDAGPVTLPDGGVVLGPNAEFVAYGAFEEARASFAAVKLADGTVLAVGGYGENGQALDSIERFDAKTGRSRLVARMPLARGEPGAALLSNGLVLIVGGRSEATGGKGVTTVELFDPATSTLSCPPQPQAIACSLEDVNAGAGLLPEGRVGPFVVAIGAGRAAVFGGRVLDGNGNEQLAEGGFVVDASGAAPTQTALAGAIPPARAGELRLVGPDGDFLIAGGRAANGAVLNDVWLFDGASGAFGSVDATLPTPRTEGAVALLSTGEAIVAGGLNVFGAPHRKLDRIVDPFTPTPTITEVAGFEVEGRVRPTLATLPGDLLLYAGGVGERVDVKTTAESVVPLTGADVLVPAGPTFVRLSPDNDLAVPRYLHEAVVVETTPDAGPQHDEVLFLGGTSTAPRRTPHPHAERYVLEDNAFFVYGLMGPGTAFEAGVLTSPGAALFSAGGVDPHTGAISANVRAWDAEPKTYALAPPLAQPRADHTMTRVTDDAGAILYLIAGGRDETGQVLASASLYDPLAGVDRPLPVGLVRARADHTATRLADGTVLFCGGVGAGGEGLDTCEVFTPPPSLTDPTTYDEARFDQAVGRMSTGRFGHTATLLDTGEVLLVGGGDVENDQAAADLFDPAAGRVTATGVPNLPRRFHGAMLLGNGRVLVVGGETYAGGLAPLKEAEVYERASGQFVPVEDMDEARVSPLLFLTVDGSVIVTGGSQLGAAESPTRALSKTELYTHPGTGLGEFDTVDPSLSYGRADGVAADVFGRAIAAGGTHRDGRLATGDERRTPVLFVDVLENTDAGN